MSVHFSSRKKDWETPQDFFDKLNKKYSFTLDVCASKDNTKCTKYFTIKEDGLKQKWSGRCWMNPPYGKTIGTWVRKAYIESKRGVLVVCLLPARTDTKWWHNYVVKGHIIFIEGRLKFIGAESGAPFPSAIVVFDK